MQVLGQQLAQALSGKLAKTFIVTLSGELGAGKSFLTRALIHALGYEGRVKSPTYTLIETYQAPGLDGQGVSIAHLDLYRLADPDELSYLGFDDVLDQVNLMFIEWPIRGEGRLPRADLHIDISYLEVGRLVKIIQPG